jgi:hypothetical protein
MIRHPGRGLLPRTLGMGDFWAAAIFGHRLLELTSSPGEKFDEPTNTKSATTAIIHRAGGWDQLLWKSPGISQLSETQHDPPRYQSPSRLSRLPTIRAR